MRCPRCGAELFDPPRTTGPRSQSACLNGWIAVICHETGMDFDELKVRVKAGAVKRGFPPPVELAVGGEIYRIFKSEAKATKSEIMAMIEETKQIAAELAILLPEYPEGE